MFKIKKQISKLYMASILGNLSLTGAWVAILAARGYSLVEIGIAETVFHIFSLTFEIPSGVFADVFGRKQMLVVSSIMRVIGSICMICSKNLTMVCAAIACFAVSYNFSSGSGDALAYDSLKLVGEEARYERYAANQLILYRLCNGISTLCAGFALFVGYKIAYASDVLVTCIQIGVLLSLREIRLDHTGTDRKQEVLQSVWKELRVCFVESLRFLKKAKRAVFLMICNSFVGAVDIVLLFFLQAKLPQTGMPDSALGSSLFIMEMGGILQGMVKRIMYNDGETMPAVSDYDLLIIDEAHRGYILDKEMGEDEALYRDQREYQSKYRSVIEYFNAVKIALTATPALQTTEIFGEPVFKYTYREAVIEGYLVDHDAPHELKTKLNTEGIHYKKGDAVTIYDPITGEIENSELIEDELDFDVDSFNKQVIVESFNRTVLEEIAKNIDPESPREQGKTLIYAVNDDHADMIVSILKDIYTEYGVDNDAIMKITGSVANGNKKKIQEAIKRFKNEDYPSIVVTVDLLTTGIDVPSISTLVFMRRVKSRILFEQMLGRATRLCKEIHKTHFDIYDPVGVYDALEDVNTMKPVVANPSTSFTQLLDGLEELNDEAHVKNQINQVIAKLQRKKKNIDEKTMEHFIDMSGGMDPTQFVVDIQKRSPEDAKKRLLAYYDLFRMLQESKPNGGRPVVISDEQDTFIEERRGYGNKDARPEDYIDAFSSYIQNNINEIAALKIICTKPRELTRDSLKSLMLTLDREGYTTQQLNTAISQLTNEEMAADIISLIRRYAIGSVLISHEARIRKAVDRLRKAHSFTMQEQNWIKRMEDYLLNESVLNITVFDEDSRFKSQGGFTKINKIFSDKLESVVLELNEYLYDDGGRTA